MIFPVLHARLPAGCVHTLTSFSLLYSSPFTIRCLQMQGLPENTCTDFTLKSFLCVLYSSFALDFGNCHTLQLILKTEPDVFFPTGFAGVHFTWSTAPFGQLHNVRLRPTDLAATWPQRGSCRIEHHHLAPSLHHVPRTGNGHPVQTPVINTPVHNRS